MVCEPLGKKNGATCPALTCIHTSVTTVLVAFLYQFDISSFVNEMAVTSVNAD